MPGGTDANEKKIRVTAIPGKTWTRNLLRLCDTYCTVTLANSASCYETRTGTSECQNCDDGLFIRPGLGSAVYYPTFNRQSFSDTRPLRYVGNHLPECTVLYLKSPQLTLSKPWKTLNFVWAAAVLNSNTNTQCFETGASVKATVLSLTLHQAAEWTTVLRVPPPLPTD